MTSAATKRQRRRPGGTLNKLPVPSSPRALAEIDQNGPMLSEIANPHFDPDNSAEPERIIVKRGRGDTLANQHARGAIDDAQFLAGRRWQELYERASISSVKAMDPAKEVVDGGKAPEFASDGQRNAMIKIANASKALGPLASRLVHQVLADNMTITQIAEMNGEFGERAASHWSFMFGKYLNELAVEFGLASAPARGAVQRVELKRAA